MSPLDPIQIARLLEPYATVSDKLAGKLATYLELLVRWNARTNLTAVRNPEEMVTRHFGESLFAGGVLAGYIKADAGVLDLGSGAGFPGLPIQLAYPGLAMTLAESQNKKASFLAEVVRTLGLQTKVFAGRAEAMPMEWVFDAVTMRAVDKPEAAFKTALTRVADGGVVVLLAAAETAVPSGLIPVETRSMPGAARTAVHVYRKL